MVEVACIAKNIENIRDDYDNRDVYHTSQQFQTLTRRHSLVGCHVALPRGHVSLSHAHVSRRHGDLHIDDMPCHSYGKRWGGGRGTGTGPALPTVRDPTTVFPGGRQCHHRYRCHRLNILWCEWSEYLHVTCKSFLFVVAMVEETFGTRQTRHALNALQLKVMKSIKGWWNLSKWWRNLSMPYNRK